MKLILFLAAIYALIFHQSNKINKVARPETTEVKDGSDYQHPAAPEQHRIDNGLWSGQNSNNKNLHPIQAPGMISSLNDKRQFAIK